MDSTLLLPCAMEALLSPVEKGKCLSCVPGVLVCGMVEFCKANVE